MKYKFILGLFCCFIAFIAAAQQPDLRWAIHSGETAPKVVVDSQGYAYSVGLFSGTHDFNPGYGNAILTALSAADIYLSKIDALGNLVWVKQIKIDTGIFPLPSYSIEARSVCISLDNIGNVCICGSFVGMPDFDPDSSSNSSGVGDSQGGVDLFVAKYTNHGDYVWGRRIAGMSMSTSNLVGKMVADNLGGLYVYGNFTGTIDFNPGVGIFNLTSFNVNNSSFGWTPFLWKLDANGNFQWATNFDGPANGGYFGGLAISSPQGEDSTQIVAVSGSFGGKRDFDHGSSAYFLNSDSGHYYLAKYTTSGQLIWAGNFGNESTSSTSGFFCAAGLPIAFDKNGQIYMCGTYAGSPNINPGVGNYFLPNIPFNGSHIDMFVAKLTADGNVIWAKTITDDNSYYSRARPMDIVVDDSGSSFITGDYKGKVDFDPGIDSSFLISNSIGDFFVMKLDSTGGFSWISGANSGSSQGGCYGRSVALDNYHNVYTSGVFRGGVDFDPSPATYFLNSNYNGDGFVYKIGPCPLNVDSISTAVCTSYTLRGQHFDSSGFYTVVFPDATGACDSIVALTLTVQPLDNAITRIGDTLVSNANLATYQWYKCDGNQLAPIAGATAQQFLPSVNGSYAVAVSYPDCQDTSDCFDVPNLGIRSFVSQNGVKVVPNPTRDRSYVTFEKPVVHAELKLVDAYGRTLWQMHNFSGTKLSLDMKAMSSGMYYLSIKQAHYVQVMKVVKM